MTQDNRIVIQPPLIDFTPSGPSGKTGQLHDDFPAPNSQARYDWMRSFLIGLLSNQSGIDEPNQRRVGTLWLKIIEDSLDSEDNLIPGSKFFNAFDGDAFKSLLEFIDVDGVSLKTVMANVLADTAIISPTTVWSGLIGIDNASQLPVPENFQGYAAFNNMRAFVWIDGILLDPRITEIPEDTKTYIKIKDGYKTKKNQRFTVELKRVIGIENSTILAVN